MSSATTGDDLATLFGEFGTVSSAKVIMDKETGNSKCFGFVEMEDETEGMNAINALNESEFQVFVLITRTFAVYGVEHLKPAFAYLATVTIAATLCLIFSYPLFIYFNTKLNPITFMKKMGKVALLAVSAASSAAALSLNLKTAEEELGISEDVAPPKGERQSSCASA